MKGETILLKCLYKLKCTSIKFSECTFFNRTNYLGNPQDIHYKIELIFI